jgi:hypothetical protein
MKIYKKSVFLFVLISLSVLFISCEKKENDDWINDFANEYEWYSGGGLSFGLGK